MAPELLFDEYYIYGEEAQCDIYSFGVVMYELFFEKKPYEHVTERVIARIAHERFRPELPQVEEFVNMDEAEKLYLNTATSCWQHDPRQRPSFIELHQQLTNLKGLVSDYYHNE
jgi:serine/threonine protein kinase